MWMRHLEDPIGFTEWSLKFDRKSAALLETPGQSSTGTKDKAIFNFYQWIIYYTYMDNNLIRNCKNVA